MPIKIIGQMATAESININFFLKLMETYLGSLKILAIALFSPN